MNNLKYPLRVSKNKPHPFFEKINDGTENNEESNRVFCIDPRKAFAIKSIINLPRSGFFFQNPSHKNKIRLFSISVKF